MTGGSGTVVVFTGITDTFERSVIDGWGICDAGIAWETAGGVEVTGTRGRLKASGPSVNGDATLSYPPLSEPFDMTFIMTAQWTGFNTLRRLTVTFASSHQVQFYLDENSVSGFEIKRPSSTSSVFPYSFAALSIYHVRIEASASETRVRIWVSDDPEPISWDGTLLSAETPSFDFINITADINNEPASYVDIDDLDITGIGGGTPIVITGR